MNIINAKQIIPPYTIINGEKVEFYENSNIIDNQIILCGHTKDANGIPHHYFTKLYYHIIGTNTYEMILKEWCDEHKEGLEDAHINIEKTAQGYYYLSAESKPYHELTGNINIETFKSKNLRTGWVWCPYLTIKPLIKDFANYSISSSTNVLLSPNEILQYFECRGSNWKTPQGTYNATTSYAIIDTTTDTIKYRHNEPLVKDVIDDIRFKDGWWWMSVHALDANGWFGYVLKSKNYNSGFVDVYTPTYNGHRVVEIYFTNTNKVYFWKSNEDGMWEGYLDNSQPPINEDNMTPIIVLENGKLRVTNPQANAQYAWQFIDLNGYIEWFAFGVEVDVKKNDGWQFFCYPMPNGSNQSNYVTYGSVPTVIKGCMNPIATNYNPLATEDDGSCILPSGDTVVVDRIVLETINEHLDTIKFLVNQELAK